MARPDNHWKRGRGKLGVLAPLIGRWEAEVSSPMGTIRCNRTFLQVLGGSYVQLNARWETGKGTYEELAVYRGDADGSVTFWSFTSDGKRSEGRLTDVTDIHPSAIGFEAQMPAGLARMAYWPDGEGGCFWAVEAKNKRGWKRFTEHHYKPF